jgi:hypothetical protein
MLRVSHYYIAAHTADRTLVGFARVCGDPYVAQVLDVITHPDYRRRGIATRCMHGVLAHLQRSHYVSVTLTDGSGIAGFYQRFGFRVCKDVVQRWERGTETISTETDSERSSAPERTRGGVMLFGLGGYLKMTVAVGDFQSGSPRVIPEAPVVKTALVDR